MQITAQEVLPTDWPDAVLVGRLWFGGGPIPVVFRNGDLYDISELAPTLSGLFELPDLAARVRACRGLRRGSFEPALLSEVLAAPCDLQAIKAAGVTFADSLIERVIEERARGDAKAAAGVRRELTQTLGGSLAKVRPGSPEAMQVKAVLTRAGLWSQYLEVGIGPDAEIFTKAQPMSAVGCAAKIGLHPDSAWSNPEPEIVLAVSSRGDIVGATLGNDVNLRDFEGRSALLLSKAKDNNASCAIGPFVRLFDDKFTLDDVRRAEIRLRVEGLDQCIVDGGGSMTAISRDPADLVAATLGPAHQYPDGLMLFLGAMFTPTIDRKGPGQGFTHLPGDVVRISSPRLGGLINEVTTSDQAPPWTFGTRALMAWLASQGRLEPPTDR